MAHVTARTVVIVMRCRTESYIRNDISDRTKPWFDDLLTYLSKHRMCRFRTFIKPVKEGVVVDVDEELRSPRFRTTSIRHGEGTGGICNPLMLLSDFIGDASSLRALVTFSISGLEG